MEPVTLFFTRSDFADVASTRAHRTTKPFEAALDRMFGERIRDDGAFGVDLWWAFAHVECRNLRGETVRYSHRQADGVVAWVREEGCYFEWLLCQRRGGGRDRLDR